LANFHYSLWRENHFLLKKLFLLIFSLQKEEEEAILGIGRPSQNMSSDTTSSTANEALQAPAAEVSMPVQEDTTKTTATNNEDQTSSSNATEAISNYAIAGDSTRQGAKLQEQGRQSSKLEKLFKKIENFEITLQVVTWNMNGRVCE